MAVTGKGEGVFLGVDGGGTKTEFLLGTQNGVERGHLLLKGCNPTQNGLAETLNVLHSGIRALLSEGGHLRAAFFGIAGCSAPDRKAYLEEKLAAALPGTSIRVAGDIENVFACSGCTGDAVAVIMGTGVVAYARTSGLLRRAGGWGRLFDGYGSGYDIGREAIRRALAAEDGFLPSTEMTEAVRMRCGGSVFHTVTDPAGQQADYIASFSGAVFDAYRRGDPDAGEIIRANMAHTAALIRHAKTLCAPEAPVVLAGGLLGEKEILLPLLKEELPQIRLMIPDLRPAEGALKNALRLAAE